MPYIVDPAKQVTCLTLKMFAFIHVTLKYLKVYSFCQHIHLQRWTNIYTLSNEINRFSTDFQHCHDVAEINPGNHAATSSLISQNFILYIKNLLLQCHYPSNWRKCNYKTAKIFKILQGIS